MAPLSPNARCFANISLHKYPLVVLGRLECPMCPLLFEGESEEDEEGSDRDDCAVLDTYEAL